jgi:hypothetical protein
MHPKEYFDRNPFREDGKGGKHRAEEKERSRSAPTDKKPFKCSSPGKLVCLIYFHKKNKNIFFFPYSLVEVKLVVLINFQNVVKKIHMVSVQFMLKLKM